MVMIILIWIIFSWFHWFWNDFQYFTNYIEQSKIQKEGYLKRDRPPRPPNGLGKYISLLAPMTGNDELSCHCDSSTVKRPSRNGHPDIESDAVAESSSSNVTKAWPWRVRWTKRQSLELDYIHVYLKREFSFGRHKKNFKRC